MSNRIYPIRSLRISSQSFGTDNLAAICEVLLDPAVLVATLWIVACFFDHGIDTSYLVLSVIVFALTYPGNPRLEMPTRVVFFDILTRWLVLFVLLLFFGWATRNLIFYSLEATEAWLLLAPASLFLCHVALRVSMPILLAIQGGQKRCIIVGMNDQGVSLARSLRDRRFAVQKLIGFIDDRSRVRLSHLGEFPLVGTTDGLRDYVSQNRIHLIYLSLPMATQPRILELLEDLRDTTASIYFVPDIFVTDLIQGRMSAVSGIPVVAVCESPFVGLNGPLKRLSDICLSLLLIVLTSPFLVAVAIGVWLSSPGPIMFKQRRYGLDGQEIMVLKFRSMTVTEDGDKVYKQVVKGDSRVTKFGAFIRKTSLDELPQLFNVLVGGMSLVGPRPHAIAVNETYRSQIPGYMVRHKVRPGITGWAQVNGFRGGDDLESMRQRLQYDIDYLRNWSVQLDLRIIVRTILVLLKDSSAY